MTDTNTTSSDEEPGADPPDETGVDASDFDDPFDEGEFDDPFADDEADEDAEERISASEAAGRIAEPIAAAVVWAIKAVLLIPFAVVKHLPKGVAIGQGLHKAGVNIIRDKADAQFVAYTIYGDGEIIPRPAGIDSETQWVETDNDEQWVAENGVDLCRVGDTPVAFGVADDHELVSPIRARLAEKIDSGGENWRVIREHDTGHVEDVNYGRVPQSVHGARGNGAGAVADGGVNLGAGGPTPSTQQTPAFDDVWVDLSNWVKDGDGMIVSMRKAYETTHQKGSSEALQDAETRGRIAERFNGDQTKWAIYLVLTALGFLCLGLFGPSLAATLGGSAPGGGGLGGVNPLMIETLTAWV